MGGQLVISKLSAHLAARKKRWLHVLHGLVEGASTAQQQTVAGWILKCFLVSRT